MQVSIDIEQVYLVIAVLLGLGGLGALVKRWLKHHINDVVNQLKTGNGITLGTYIVQSTEKLSQLSQVTDELRTCVKEIRDELIEHRLKDH